MYFELPDVGTPATRAIGELSDLAKSNLELLYDDLRVAGIAIKPWTFAEKPQHIEVTAELVELLERRATGRIEPP